MNRRLAYLLILLVWAAVYLPGLDTKALKGEEARRILPAVTMLETGNWVVPYLNGSPYLRKPPMINWAIAGSLSLTGQRNEWSSRLPSVLAMLVLGVAVFWTGSRWLSVSEAFAAALISLLGIGLWEKGRMAEIDAMYTALTGMAFGFWLAAWINRKTGFRLWFWPLVCLGLGLLTKGPMHLLLFYLLVIPLLVAAREKKQLWSVAHLVSFGVAVLIFAVWALPYLRETASLNAASVWVNQMNNTLGRGRSGKLLLNEFDSVANCLPWVLLAPLWWSRRVLNGLEERRRLLLRVGRWVMAVGFLGPMLIDGMIPRYVLPLYPVVALMVVLVMPSVWPRVGKGWSWFCGGVAAVSFCGMAIAPFWIGGSKIDWPALLPLLLLCAAFPVIRCRVAPQLPGRLAVYGALAFSAAVGAYASVAIPYINRVHPAAPVVAGAGINAVVPADAVLYIVDPGYEPAFFYIKRHCNFVRNAEQLPRDCRFVLVSEHHKQSVKNALPDVHKVGVFPGLGKRKLVLVQRGGDAAAATVSGAF